MSTPNPVPPTIVSAIKAEATALKATAASDVAVVESKVVTFTKQWGIPLAALIVGFLVGHFL